MALAAACAATLTLAPAALADGGNPSPRDPDARRFVGNVSVPSILQHSVELEAIGKLNDDTREVFSPGYQESLDYVVKTLRSYGYNPKVTPFNFPFWEETQPPVLNQVSPTPKTYRPGTAADSDTAERRLHHDGQLADGRADQRAGLPGRRHRRPARRRFGVRLRRRGLRGRRGQGRADPARDVPVRGEVGARAGRGRDRRDHLQRGQHAPRARTRPSSTTSPIRRRRSPP